MRGRTLTPERAKDGPRVTRVDIWDLDTVRAMPAESMPAGSHVQFVGGMMDGTLKHLPTTVDDGPVPFTSYDHGAPGMPLVRTEGLAAGPRSLGLQPGPDPWVTSSAPQENPTGGTANVDARE